MLREPTLNDYRLLTEGPQAASGLGSDIPYLPPVVMRSTWKVEEPEDTPSLDNGGPRIGLPSESNPNIDQRDLKREDD